MSVIYNLEELIDRFKTLESRHVKDVMVKAACHDSIAFIRFFLLENPKAMRDTIETYTKIRNRYAPHLLTRNKYTLYLMDETIQCMQLECHDMEMRLGSKE